jgi:hypothetical protein
VHILSFFVCVLVDEELWHPMAENLLETFSAIIFHTLLA